MSNIFEAVLAIAHAARQAAEAAIHPTLGTLRKPPERRQLGRAAARLVVNPRSLIVADWTRQVGGMA